MRSGSLRIAPGSAADFRVLREALAGAGLPHEDLDPSEHLFLMAREGDRLLGTIALEGRGETALLRSLWVDPGRRGEGIAARLCGELRALARRRGVLDLYLLTTDARGYFERQGFRVVDRERAPENVKGSAQFRSLCPATAVCMVRSLRDEEV